MNISILLFHTKGAKDTKSATILSYLRLTTNDSRFPVSRKERKGYKERNDLFSRGGAMFATEFPKLTIDDLRFPVSHKERKGYKGRNDSFSRGGAMFATELPN